MTKKQYSKGFGDRYPGPNTSGRCIWDACMTHETNHSPPKPDFIKKLNLTYIDKQGKETPVNPANVSIEISSCKSFMQRFPEEYEKIKENIGKSTLEKSSHSSTSQETDLDNNLDSSNLLPEEIPEDQELWEGARKQITINAYERNSHARIACLAHYGYSCVVCSFNFENTFGLFAKNFIHVHHITPLSEINEAYKIDPIRDLRPVCPNCHAAIHIGGEIRSIEEMQAILKNH